MGSDFFRPECEYCSVNGLCAPFLECWRTVILIASIIGGVLLLCITFCLIYGLMKRRMRGMMKKNHMVKFSKQIQDQISNLQTLEKNLATNNIVLKVFPKDEQEANFQYAPSQGCHPGGVEQGEKVENATNFHLYGQPVAC